MNDTTLYSHPTIREKSHDFLLNRLQQIRDRRLVAAIQYEQVRKGKVEKLEASLKAKWEKQDERNRLLLLKIDEAIDKLDVGIRKQHMIASDLTLTEQEFEL
jgi:hypothetical protein